MQGATHLENFSEKDRPISFVSEKDGAEFEWHADAWNSHAEDNVCHVLPDRVSLAASKLVDPNASRTAEVK